jgi:hypothetical protein
MPGRSLIDGGADLQVGPQPAGLKTDGSMASFATTRQMSS